MDSEYLEAIEGEVRSEPLNRNFSALDSEIGYAAGYISGDTTLVYDDDGVVTAVSTPVSDILLTYNSDGILTEVTEEFRHRTVITTLYYNAEGEMIIANKEVVQR